MGRTRSTTSRRRFLKGAAGLLAAPAVVLGQEARSAPSNRITLGLIGVGSMGLRHVKGFLQEDDCQIVAICDVDAKRREAAAGEVNKHYGNTVCAQYSDFRELLARKDVDALCISVPDHWHGVISTMGVRAGKDVYGEKPLTLTIGEGTALVREVRRYACVWQTGSWQRSTRHFRFACELVRNGRIGRLRRVEVGIGIGPTIGPQPVMPVPEGFDYEMWLGPAPWAPYTEKRCHWNFRWILDYGGGQVTDWGAHHVDIAQWGMGTDDTGPVEVEGVGEFPTEGLYDAAVTYRFQCTYADGVVMYVGSSNHYPMGVRFIGDDGWVHVTRNGLKTNPERLIREEIGPNEIRLARAQGDHRKGHRRDFLDCIRSRARTVTPVEVGHRSASVCHLGNIAMLLGRKVHWDPIHEQILDDPTGSRMLHRPMRSPWRL